MQKTNRLDAVLCLTFLFSACLAGASDWQWRSIGTAGNWGHSENYSVVSSCGASYPFSKVSSAGGESYGGFIYPFDRRVMRTRDDFDGDGKSDCWFYHPSQVWYVIYSTSTQTVSRLSFGLPGAVTVPEDYDGDHLTDYAVYQESSGLWVALLSSMNYASVSANFGGPGCMPIPADFDGDQKADPAIYHPASGVWTATQSSLGYAMLSGILGGPAYTAVTGDFDEDDKADGVAYSEAAGYLALSMSGCFAAFRRAPYSVLEAGYGGPGFSLLAEDYDGDGCADVAAYDRASGSWFVMNYKLDPIIWGLQWGGANYAPLAGDFDGDGLADASVLYRDLRDTIWQLNESTDGPRTVSARGLRPTY